MGRLDRIAEASIEVRIELRSGNVQKFEISEDIFRYLEALAAEGLDGAALCKAWLPQPMWSDPAMRVEVSGQRTDGTRVDVSFDCKPGSALVDREAAAPSAPGNGDAGSPS